MNYNNSYDDHSKSLEVSGAWWALVSVGSNSTLGRAPAEDLAWMRGGWGIAHSLPVQGRFAKAPSRLALVWHGEQFSFYRHLETQHM